MAQAIPTLEDCGLILHYDALPNLSNHNGRRVHHIASRTVIHIGRPLVHSWRDRRTLARRCAAPCHLATVRGSTGRFAVAKSLQKF